MMIADAVGRAVDSWACPSQIGLQKLNYVLVKSVVDIRRVIKQRTASLIGPPARPSGGGVGAIEERRVAGDHQPSPLLVARPNAGLVGDVADQTRLAGFAPLPVRGPPPADVDPFALRDAASRASWVRSKISMSSRLPRFTKSSAWRIRSAFTSRGPLTRRGT